MHRIKYALNSENKITYIDDVEKGISCNCHCAFCNSPLVARKGDVRIPHFAHYNSPECKMGFQTSIHYMAKEIIYQNKTISLPFDFEMKTFPVSSVVIEKRIDNFIPDLIVTIGNRQLIVEIYVTHKTDENKLAKIRNSCISAVEIDFHDLSDFCLTKESISKELLNRNRIKWLYNNKSDQKKQLISTEGLLRKKYGHKTEKHIYCTARKYSDKWKCECISLSRCEECPYNYVNENSDYICGFNIRKKLLNYLTQDDVDFFNDEIYNYDSKEDSLNQEKFFKKELM